MQNTFFTFLFSLKYIIKFAFIGFVSLNILLCHFSLNILFSYLYFYSNLLLSMYKAHLLYNKALCLFVCIYILYVLAIAGQTAGPNWPTFFERIVEYSSTYVFFLSKTKIFLSKFDFLIVQQTTPGTSDTN